MDFRSLSFFYLKDNYLEEYKNSIRESLKLYEEGSKGIAFPQVIVEFNGFNGNRDPNSTGHLFLYEVDKSSNKFEEVCKYILSKDRKHIPISVMCKDKKDFGMIENILRENYGEKGRLTNGFLGMGLLFKEKTIKRG
jgi:hypothetical protein